MVEEKEATADDVSLYRKNAMGRFFMAFSLSRNLNKLFSMRNFGPVESRRIEENKFEKHMQLLDGVRVLSMFWVILGHTYVFSVYSATYNPFIMKDYYKQPLFQIVIGALFAVDTFFFLSAFLGAYSFLRLRNVTPGLFLKAYWHRFYRLIPMYAFVMMVGFYLTYYIGNGPVWGLYGDAWADCGKWWWTNLLFINNIYPLHFGNTCMIWSWYLANDMQFFLLLPPLMVVTRKSRIAGVLCILVLMCVSIVLNMVTMFDKGYGVLTMLDDNYFLDNYTKPWIRITPYLLGLLAGIAFVDFVNQQRNM